MIKLQKFSALALVAIGILFLVAFDKPETKTAVTTRTLPYKHYRIVAGNDAQELELSINYYIKNGWEPLGGVVAEGNSFYQSIVK